MQTKLHFLVAGFLAATWLVQAQDYTLHTFKKVTLSDKFYAEGAYYGDFNHDGKMDLVEGPFWYEGPDFQKKHEYRPAQSFDPGAYSDNFLTFAYDFNGDGWTDILVIDTPGNAAYWYENSKGGDAPWAKHLAVPVVMNEAQEFCDINGDGKPELLYNIEGYLGYATPNWKQPNEPWTFHAISSKGKYQRYTHGLGHGDINGDGRQDYLEAAGWWEQPASLANDPVWTFHPFQFCTDAAQMLVYDVNGDGLNDVVTCLHPHKYGLAWFEQVRENGQISFRKHQFMGEQIADSPYGIRFTQMHAFAAVDMDGDGVLDFVTGKRWWAHKPPTDPDSDGPAVLYWFRTVRLPNGQVDFVPYLIDDNSGVGTQVEVKDVNGDGLPDIVMANKKGNYVFLHQTQKVSKEEWEKAQPKKLEK